MNGCKSQNDMKKSGLAPKPSKSWGMPKLQVILLFVRSCNLLQGSKKYHCWLQVLISRRLVRMWWVR